MKKYSEGVLTGEKKEVMDAWYNSLRYDARRQQDPDRTKSRIWNGIVLRTTDLDDPDHGLPGGKSWWKSNFFKVAACLALLIGIGGAALFYIDIREDQATAISEPAAADGAGWHFIDNTGGSDSKSVLLSDGSRVTLEPGSTLRYPDRFSDHSRRVFTEGDVLFDVSKDSSRPFFAFAGEVVVQVLGTSFTIRNIKGKAATEVAVITGKVVVEKAQGTDRGNTDIVENKVVLKPNEKVTFFRNSEHYITGLVDNPIMIEKTDEFTQPEAFDFDEIPLSQILEKLERAYGVSIAVSDDSILGCQITADLSSDNLYGKMELICAIMNAKYEITGNTILLSGGVCSILGK